MNFKDMIALYPAYRAWSKLTDDEIVALMNAVRTYGTVAAFSAEMTAADKLGSFRSLGPELEISVDDGDLIKLPNSTQDGPGWLDKSWATFKEFATGLIANPKPLLAIIDNWVVGKGISPVSEALPAVARLAYYLIWMTKAVGSSELPLLLAPARMVNSDEVPGTLEKSKLLG